MRALVMITWMVMGLSLTGNGQLQYTISGTVTDDAGLPLPGCHVHYRDVCSITDSQGQYLFTRTQAGPTRLLFTFVGFQSVDTLIVVKADHVLDITVRPDVQALNEVAVISQRTLSAGALRQEPVTNALVMQNYAGTFAKSIERIVGVNTMDIGVSASKPVIRGMSSNRVVVSENGIKQEGQQWGADHGLELDPFSVESAVVVKGASGIEYGSDAIGGYVQVRNDNVPSKQSLSGDATLLGRSVNNTLGASLYIQGRGDRFFYKGRVSALDFGDYKIPTDSIVYLTRDIPIYNKRLKNTAGNELNLSGQVGVLTERLKSTVSVSRVYQKSGFFPGAHGAPDLDRVSDDGDDRNVAFPFQVASHLKVLSNTRYYLGTGAFLVDLGYQNNHRQEWSAFHTHYPNQTPPDQNSDLELDFRLHTYNVNLKYEWAYGEGFKLVVGTQNQWKENDIAGYNFLLPAYSAFNSGWFAKHELRWSDRLTLFAALRYDWSQLQTVGFFDPVLYDYFIAQGQSEEEANFYANRSEAMDKQQHDFSWMLGAVLRPGEAISVSLNLGKTFRSPTAIELGANGIHHGSFRHEVGDPDLSSEKSYYLDGSLDWSGDKSTFYIGPYLYYFTNYLFLQPTGEWSALPHAGQLYRYSQSEALMAGLEVSMEHDFSMKWSGLINVEYIYNRQLGRATKENYPLPFSTPVNGFAELSYEPFQASPQNRNWRFFVNSRFALDQNRIARNEQVTPGYVLMGGGVSVDINTKSLPWQLLFQVNNLLNRKYYNHVSFYRKLEIPESGRNFQLMVKVPFAVR